MKILHLTVVRDLTCGQLNQLRCENRVAKALDQTEWITLAYHTSASSDDFVRRLPWLFRPMFLRNLFAWLWLMRNAKKYDFVMSRHMTFDPFAFIFARWVLNRVTVHHAKEVEELTLVRQGWKGRAASAFERWSGRVAVCNAEAILGVTTEIRDYELAFYSSGKKIPASIYPNGICVKEVELLRDCRSSERLEIAFVCGTFSPWHGLDILLDQLENIRETARLDTPITLHLIGNLTCEQKHQIQRIEQSIGLAHVKAQGLLEPEDYRPLLERCQLGLSSLATYRKGLSEAATLKVREMLALGLPVYSGHQDTALPDGFPWYLHGSASLVEICDFAKRVSGVSRREVRDDACPWIEKGEWMKAAAEFLGSVREREG